ncbi:hydroxylysine kinase-like [Pecten maximus]|uniref:hydroxylysine kinase-like n=1 Tax=Pecten maximus TaxID=6579 RepID=UPI00145867FF|nr:hydroxylysine kinase-like [Pecten maximus]XP_033757039.1 hydroxylysine kinase-like [Pecten maximus]
MSKDDRTVVNPGEVIRPYVDLDIVKKFVKCLYDLDVVDGKELNSYDDRNYHVIVSEETTNEHIRHVCVHGYVLKVLNSLDSRHEDYVEAQNDMILHVAEKGIPTPRPVKNVTGKLMSLESFPCDKKLCQNQDLRCVVRLLEYLPGRILLGVPYTMSLLSQIGHLTGRLDNALADFQHPAHTRHRRIWNLSELPDIQKFIYCIKDDHRSNLIQEVLDSFRCDVTNNYDLLKTGTLHADVNDYNVLVSEHPTNGLYDVIGILDFGDSVYSCYVFEIAIIMCYAILGSDVIDPIDAGGHTLAGYLLEFSLGREDLKVLKQCVCARFAQSLVMGAYSAENDPENAEYVLSTAQKGWTTLKSLWDMPKRDLYDRWDQICREQYGIDTDFGINL